MAIPTNREEFTKHCLRRAGGGVIRHNVTDEQIDDRVDEALYKYARHHYDGSEKVYVAHQLQAGDVSSKSITMNQNIIGVVDVFSLGFGANPSSGSFFNAAAYQVMLSDLIFAGGGLTGGLSNYVTMRMGLNTMEMFLVGKFPFRYGEKTNVLYLDCSPEKLREGGYVLIEAYRINDPTTYPDVWADIWLQKYATALIKQNWGQNLSKYSGAQLPGGITVNGLAIKAEADAEIEKLEDELISTYSPIVHDLIG